MRTVEVVQVPGQADNFLRIARLEQPEHLERPEHQSFSFDFSTNDTDSWARQGLAEALRSPNLNAEQRQEMEKELQKLAREGLKTARLSSVLVLDDLHLGLDGVVANYPPHPSDHGEQNKREYARLKFDKLVRRQSSDADARQTDHAANHADRDTKQADHNAKRVEGAGDHSESEVRRAELRARIAAAQAELHALDYPASRGITAPPASRFPHAPLPPTAAQGPTPPPPPPAPNTDQLGSELLRDGLIKNKNHYSLELDDRGGMIDGQPLTPTQVAKYRKLLNKPKSKGNSSFEISVDVH